MFTFLFVIAVICLIKVSSKFPYPNHYSARAVAEDAATSFFKGVLWVLVFVLFFLTLVEHQDIQECESKTVYSVHTPCNP